jgi:hypothetical protein
VGKLIAFRQKRARTFRRQRARDARKGEPTEAFIKPFVWIITARRPTAVLDELGPSQGEGWPAGVYFSPRLFRVGIVVASELPRDRSTVLVRIMAAGPLLPQAIEDLGALPADAHERVVAEQILLNLQHALGKKPSRSPEEQEFIVTMHNTWEKARAQGRVEGRAEEAARALLTALRVRRIAVPDAVREHILAQKDLERLERWYERAIVAASLDDVLGEPS